MDVVNGSCFIAGICIGYFIGMAACGLLFHELRNKR